MVDKFKIGFGGRYTIFYKIRIIIIMCYFKYAFIGVKMDSGLLDGHGRK